MRIVNRIVIRIVMLLMLKMLPMVLLVMLPMVLLVMLLVMLLVVLHVVVIGVICGCRFQMEAGVVEARFFHRQTEFAIGTLLEMHLIVLRIINLMRWNKRKRQDVEG